MSRYETIQVEFQDAVCFLKINRPEANNTINNQLVSECNAVLNLCEETASVVVLSGSPEVFCFGADFSAIARNAGPDIAPEALYDLWNRLATGPYVTVSHVRGKVNAGGVGFVAASDIVLASETAQFSLSELLFGLYPACVLPFLMRRIGFQKANYLTLSTQNIAVKQAFEWGLVDAFEANSEVLLRRHLQRLRRLSKVAIQRYKGFINTVAPQLQAARSAAVAGSRDVLNDAAILRAITRYVKYELFPWESGNGSSAD